MFKRKTFCLAISFAAFLTIVITTAVVFRWDLLLTDRNNYLEDTVSETQTDWTYSPREIALDLAAGCSDSPNKCQLEEVKVFQIASNRAIIFLQMRHLFGDSVDASQTRIELLRVGETWKVAWAGRRWQCRPFRGNSRGWTIEICP